MQSGDILTPLSVTLIKWPSSTFIHRFDLSLKGHPRSLRHNMLSGFLIVHNTTYVSLPFLSCSHLYSFSHCSIGSSPRAFFIHTHPYHFPFSFLYFLFFLLLSFFFLFLSYLVSCFHLLACTGLSLATNKFILIPTHDNSGINL